MAEKEVLLTVEGLKQLKKEIIYLKSTKRIEVAKRIKQAIEFGDISENSEYDEAKNDQAKLEAKILEVEKKLKYAQVIDESKLNNDDVKIGSKVVLFDYEYNEEIEYKIVGSTEANPAKKRISNESPVGKTLLGRKKGDEVEVEVPGGISKFKILSIAK